MLCYRCDRISMVKSVHKNLSKQYKYQCTLCPRQSQSARVHNGFIFCKYCNSRCKRFSVGEEFLHSPCIEKKNNCNNTNCNNCFYKRYTELSNVEQQRIIFYNITTTNNSYTAFLLEYSDKFKQRFANLSLEKFNRT